MLDFRSILRLSKTALISLLENHVRLVEPRQVVSKGNGYVNVEWHRRHVIVGGQAAPPGLTIAFEGREGISVCEDFSLNLQRPDRRSGATVTINGTRDVLELSAPSLGKILGAALLSAPKIALTLLTSLGDILTFVRTKDPATSDRLRRRFGVTPASDRGRAIPTDFFKKGPSAIDDIADATVIIPVFNAAEDLERLLPRIGSIQQSILFINDGSSDPRVKRLLIDFVTRNGNSRIITSEQNEGFVSSVNKGLDASSGHVVILNSDTIPPCNDWISQVLNPILHNTDIASVTPFSNNAEIFSIPNIDNSEPIGIEIVNKVQEVASQIDKDQIVIPTGIGFCMAMNRDFIHCIGGFDSVFGRGYGEEVDWCQKAKRAGGRNIALASVFVGHVGGQSFGSQKAERIRSASKIISARYPDYDASVQKWVEDAPAQTQSLALSIAWVAAVSTDSVPIYLGHSMGGGAETALQEEIASALRNMPGVLVLRVGGPSLWRIELKGNGFSHVGDASRIETVADFLAPLKERHFVYSCGAGGRHPLDAPELLMQLMDKRSTLDVRMHDYFPISPSWNLLSEHGEFKGVPKPSTTDKAHSIPRLSGRPAVPHAEWRSAWASVLLRAREITVFSKASAALVSEAYPIISKKIVVRPHKTQNLPRKIKKRGTAVGILGSLNQAKGAEVIQRLSTYRNFSRKLVVLGELDGAYSLRRPHVFHGRYDHSRISELAEKYGIGLWFIPSICPETFSFATHEALATGLPVIAFTRGAQGEAVASAANGHPIDVDPTDACAVAQHIEDTFKHELHEAIV